jgi:peroxiredoxin
MQKIISALLLISLFHISFAQLAQPQAQSFSTVTLSGEFQTCAPTDSLRLYDFVGLSLRPLAAIGLKAENGKYTFSVNLNGIKQGFYFLGIAPDKTIPLILGSEAQMHLVGNCNTFDKNLQIMGSEMNRDYQTIMQKVENMAQQTNALFGQFRNSPPNDPYLMGELLKLDRQKMGLLDSLKKSNSYMAKLVAMRTYLSYQHNRTSPTQLEGDYLAENYFKFVDFSDPVYDNVTMLFNVVQGYAKTLTMVGIAAEEQQAAADKLLKNLTKEHNAYALILLGLATGFKGADDDCFKKYALQYMNDYPNLNAAINQDFQKHLSDPKVKKFMIGELAPDFKLLTPEGKELALSDLKGKIVMIDFWASWCRPCRKENPRAVQIYNRFKNKGFEILSVSLDQQREAWLQAIEADGMPWKHISDLKGWQCEAAKLYGVSSIPYTMVVDKEGRILAKNLRGEVLERRIAKEFEKK